ncbi:hypothetical protein D3C84_890000 [compost metagenome]
MNAIGDGPGFGQDGAAGVGELRLACGLTVKQRHAELHFQVGNRVADDRSGSMQLSGSRCKTANFNDRQEHAQLVQCRCSGIRNHACFLERNGQYYPGIANRFISMDRLPGLRFQPDPQGN